MDDDSPLARAGVPKIFYLDISERLDYCLARFSAGRGKSMRVSRSFLPPLRQPRAVSAVRVIAMSKKKNDFPIPDDAFAVSKKKDLDGSAGGQSLVDRVRSRLVKTVVVDRAIVTTARLLFYLLEAPCFSLQASAAKIEKAINDGPQYFGKVGYKAIQSFAERSSNKPEQPRYFEYIRFLALVIKAHPHLSGDPYIQELLADFDVVKFYSAAATMADEEFEAFATQNQVTGVDLNAVEAFFYQIYETLGLAADAQDEIGRQLLGARVREVFYSFRYTSEPGQLSCTLVEVFARADDRPFLSYETKSKRRHGRREVAHNSRGLIFAYEGSVVFCGRVDGPAAGMHFLVIPRPIDEVEGRLRALVLTPDILHKRPPIASRILLIRESNLPKELRRTGLLPAASLPSAIASELSDFVGNAVFGSVKPNASVEDNPASSFAELSNLIDEAIAKKKEDDYWPFTIVQEDGVIQKVNPFRMLNYDVALGAYMDGGL